MRYGFKNMGNTQLWSMFSRIPFPILIIAGADDKTMPMREAPNWLQENPKTFWQKAARLNPKDKVKIIENCGHMSNIEYPQIVNQAIDQFLASS